MHVTLRTHAHEIEKYSMLYHDEADATPPGVPSTAACPGVELTSQPAPQHGVQRPGVTKGSVCWRWRHTWA